MLLQGIYAYCTLNDGVEYTDGLKKELVMAVREQIGAFAAPDVIHWAPGEIYPQKLLVSDLHRILMVPCLTEMRAFCAAGTCLCI